MDDHRIRAGGDDAARERVQRRFRILIVDADPALHGDGNAHRPLHGADTLGNQRRLRHQAGAEPAVLHPIGRTADIEIDFVIAEILADPGRDREITRIRATELQRHRMFDGIETEQTPPIAVKHGARRQHLRVEPRPPRQQAMEHPAVPVGPVHHRGDGKAVV